MENEVTYLNYGNNKVDQKKFLENSANAVTNYVSQQPWSEKRKKLFLEAYSDLMNRGVTGASNDSGQWQILYNGDVDLDSKSKKQKEMYGEAAYFIQQQLNNSIAKEEKQEENKLAKFSNSDFISNLEGYIGTHQFGGQNFNIASQWNTLDKADSKTGIRETQNRAKKLAESLRGYAQSLKDDSYNFENSPFTDINDFKNKLNEAANHLEKGTWTPEILNKIGLDPEKYLSTGANDIVNQETGQTRQQYIDALLEAEAEKQEEEIRLKRLKELAEQKQNSGILSRISGIHGKEAKLIPEKYNEYLTKYGVGQKGFDSINNEIKNLLETAASSGLTNSQKRKLGNFLYHIRKNNPNYQHSNLSAQDWAELSKFKNLGSTNRKGFIRLPWQLADGRYTYADDKGNVYFLRPQNKQKLQGPAVDWNKLNNYRNNFLKSENTQALNTTIGNNNGLTDDMKADLAAMGLDLVSAGSAFAPGYGTLASAITGIGSTLTGAYADRARGESWGSTLGTAGFGLSMDILGLIPGVGVGAKAAKIAKVVAKGAKWLGPALGGLAAMSYGPGALSAYKKFISGKKDNITSEELRDFTYAIRAIAAGGIRKAGATYQGNRTLARAKAKGHVVETSGKQSASITTKNGKVDLSDEEFKTLKGNGSRDSKIELLKNKGIKEEDIEWKGLNPAKGRFKTSSKSSKLSGLNESVESSQLKWNTTSNDYKGIKRFSNENLLRNFTTMSTSNSGIWNGIKNRWTGQDILNRLQTQSSNTSVKEPQKLLPFIKGRYNPPKTESQEVISISRALPQPGGTHKGNIIDNSRPGTINSNRITLGEANQEFNDFHRMYITSSNKNSKVPSKPFGNGYGTSKEPENGSLSFNGITATLTKLDNDRGFSITFGKSDDTVIAKQYKDIQQLRSNFAKQLNEVIKKQSNVKETAAILRQFKAKGWLKQGGTIDKQKIHKYKKFINK